MAFELKLYKSAGTPVTAAVHRLLVEANGARDHQAWPRAASAYREALKLDPQLAHIWVQYGHALKETGELTSADAAYRQALVVRPHFADAQLQLGHLKKLQGDSAGAGRCYLAAARSDPQNADALAELHRMVARGSQAPVQDLLTLLAPALAGAAGEFALPEDRAAVVSSRRELAEALRREATKIAPSLAPELTAAIKLLERDAAEVEASSPPSGHPTMVFDISDLISYFWDSRLPTGIQRVQIEILSSALASTEAESIRICCFVEKRDAWVEIAPSLFVTLSRLSLASSDRTAPDWLIALTRLHATLGLAEDFHFPSHTRLINLGTSWWIPNYFLLIRQAKMAAGAQFEYIPFVHDFIPLLASQCCAQGLVQDFVEWVVGVFQHADRFLVNSEATKRDLLLVAATLGHQIDPDHVTVVRLDADFRKPQAPPVRKDFLANLNLHRTPFILFVSTIEARKNHLLAFDAWLTLIRRHGIKNVPKLVCVGKRGWLEQDIMAKLQDNADLQNRVVVLSGISDAELSELYKACLFTLYPSTYEGWGLPITESLCHGKTPVTSDGSSLPEAGGTFAVYFEAGSGAQLTAALEDLIYDPARLRACEAKIAEAFQPRSWRDLSDQVLTVAAAPTAHAATRDAARQASIKLGAYHPLRRNREVRIWDGMRSAEAFRIGTGWWGQDDFGCWTKPQGAMLALPTAGPHKELRLHLLLHGLPTSTTDFHIEVDGEEVELEGTIDRHEWKWVSLAIPGCDEPAPIHRLIVRGETAEDLADCTDGRDPRTVCVGLAGFFICEATDAEARMAFLEAVTLGNLAELAFSRPALARAARQVAVRNPSLPPEPMAWALQA